MASTPRRQRQPQRVIVTGGPGAGKTTLLLALQVRGHVIVADSPRAIIQARRRRGLSARPSAHEFAQETLRMDIDNFDRHAATPGPVFFERSVVDALCGLDGVVPFADGELTRWLSKYRYGPTAFILPPWKDIYVTDAERDHTFEHAESVFRALTHWYGRCGYELVEVPRMTVEERAAYVLQALENRNA